MLDTPTRAAQCGRPRTRGWSDLLEAAKSDEEEAVRLRSELNRYLEEADNFSKRRAARKEARAALLKEASAAATSPRRKIKSLSPANSPLPPSQAGSSSNPRPNVINPSLLSSQSTSTPLKEKPPVPPSTPLKEKQLLSPAPQGASEQVPATPPRKLASKLAQHKPEASVSTPPPKKSAAKSAQETPHAAAKSSPAAPTSSAKKRSVQDDGVEYEDLSHESVGALCEILSTLSSPWMKRVSALRALSGNESLEIDTALTQALCVQLADLRSKVVVDAAHTIEVHSERISEVDALYIAAKGLACVSVKKAVMADARETAVIKALAPLHSSDSAWAAVLEHVGKQPTERARSVAVKATMEWLSLMDAKRDAQLAGILDVCLVDKSGKVRDEGKALFKATEKKLNKQRATAVKNELSQEALSKLPKKKKKGGIRSKLNMKEEIRRKRLAMKKKEEAAGKEDTEGFRMAASEASSKDAAPITTRDMNKLEVPASPEPVMKKKKLNSAQASPSVLANKENNTNL